MPPLVIVRDNPTSGSVPLAADVGVGELVVNTTDGYLYTKNVVGNVVRLNPRPGGFISASYALTSSYALNGGGGAAFPFTGSAAISGALSVTGDVNINNPSLAVQNYAVGANSGFVRLSSTEFRIGPVSNQQIVFMQNSAIAWYIDTTKFFLPNVNNTYDIGATAQRVRTVWTNAISSSQPIASASYALTGGSPAFPYVGDAVITGSLYVSGTVGSVTAVVFNSLSDRDQKTNITNIDDAASIVDQLNGVRFNWKSSHLPSAGLIAQDVEAILPELVTSHDEGKVLNYNGVIGVLVEAVKQLTRRVEELERDAV